MISFARHFIVPLAKSNNWKSFCEIGASLGLTTDVVLSIPDIAYAIIDPGLDKDLTAKYAAKYNVKVRRGNSLDVLPMLDRPFDCILIDGDHNWYTVYNELRVIRERQLLKRGGMIFLHDVSWPYGRRDMYYQPDTIPAEARFPCELTGIVRGKNALSPDGINSSLLNATHEGGPRNGVLTAIEDFIRDYGSSDYNFCHVHYQYGLGILQYRSRRLSEDVAFSALRAKARVYEVAGFCKRLIPSRQKFGQQR